MFDLKLSHSPVQVIRGSYYGVAVAVKKVHTNDSEDAFRFVEREINLLR